MKVKSTYESVKGILHFCQYAFLISSNSILLLIACCFRSVQFSSFQFSCSVVSDSLRPHGLQHTRPPCPSPTSRVDSNSSIESVMPSSVVPFSHLQSFPASGSFQMSEFFALGGQRTGISGSTSVLPMNIQD